MSFSKNYIDTLVSDAQGGNPERLVFAVVGTPISHSLSPRMHNAVFAQFGLDRTMIALDPESESGYDTWANYVRMHTSVGGFCTTVPYKAHAVEVCARISDVAQKALAVNTLTRTADGELIGHNTDVEGFLVALNLDLGIDPAGKRFVLFGAGGVANAIAVALSEAHAAQVTVVGRNAVKVEAFVSRQAESSSTEWLSATALPDRHFDCAINATSLGLRADDELVAPIEWITEHTSAVFDAVYARKGTTKLVEAFRKAGGTATDGRTMLAAQGAAQARTWGISQPIEEIRSIMIEALQHEEDACTI